MAPRRKPKPKPPLLRKHTRYSPELKVRAHNIFRESGGLAKPMDIAIQLHKEGFGDVDPAAINRWCKTDRWDEKAVRAPAAAALSEEIRKAVQIQVPDDLDRVERASSGLAECTTRLAHHVSKKIPDIEIKTPADLEIVTRCMADLLKVHFAVAKSIQDLRLLHVSSNFGNGQVIPPELKEDRPPISEQERIISNFQKTG